jgi:ATP-dependent Clp protease ATP-binding subunit ClpX
MAKMDEKKSVRCSFCGKTQSQVNRMIAGSGSYICDECVRLCMSIVDENYDAGKPTPIADRSQTSLRELPKPTEIKAYLDEYIVGQEKAKISLSWRYTTIINGSCTVPETRSNCRRATFFSLGPRKRQNALCPNPCQGVGLCRLPSRTPPRSQRPDT